MLVPLVPPDLLAALLLIEPGHFHAGAKTTLAPAVFGIEREQPWTELGEAAPAGGARALGREYDHSVGARREDVHQALAEIECPGQSLMQCRVGLRIYFHLCNRQLDRVFLEPRQPGPLRGGDVRAVHAKC